MLADELPADGMAVLAGEIRYALRLLFKTPALSVFAILALGIGANTAIFSLIDSVLIRPLQFRDPARLVVVPACIRFSGEPSGPKKIVRIHLPPWR